MGDCFYCSKAEPVVQTNIMNEVVIQYQRRTI